MDLQPSSMNLIKDLRDYFEPIFANIKNELGRLYSAQQEVTSFVRGIEIQVNQTMTEARKDIEALKERDHLTAEELTAIKRKLDEYHEEAQARHEDQIAVNNGIKTLTKLLYAIFAVVLSMVLYFLRDLLLYGGIRGLP